MKKIALILITLCCIAGFYSCYYDKADIINPSSNLCDTTVVSYANDIAPIIQENCTSCHSTNAAASGLGGSIPLDTYNSLQADVALGWLLPAVNWQINLLPASASASFSPQNMPQNLPQLNSCQLNKLNAWVNQGAKNN